MKDLPITILEWLWGWLPDRCQMPGCCRKGVRGNENIIGDKLVCDYCHADLVRKGALQWEARQREKDAGE